MSGNSEEPVPSRRAIEPREEPFLLNTEQDEVAWHDTLARFEEQIYPIFKARGFSMAEAMNIWELNRISNYLDSIETLLMEPDDGR